MKNVEKFFELVDRLKNERPYVNAEISRTFRNGWVAEVRKTPTEPIWVSGNGLTADEACMGAIRDFNKITDEVVEEALLMNKHFDMFMSGK